MENFLIRTRETSGMPQQTQGAAKATTSSEGFQVSFKEFMQKVGSNTAKGINIAASNSAINKFEDRSDQTLNRAEQDYARSSEQDYDRGGDYRRRDERPDADRRDNSYDERRPPVERRDDQVSNNASERGNRAKDDGQGEARAARTDDAPNKTQDGPKKVDRQDEPKNVSKETTDNSAKQDQATNEKTVNNEAASKKNTKTGGEDVTAADPTVIANVVIAAAAADKILASPKKSLMTEQSGEGDKAKVAEQVLGQAVSKANVKVNVKGDVKGEARKTGTKSANKAAVNVAAKSNGKAGAGAKVADTTKVKTNTNSAISDQARAGADMDADFKSRLAQQAAGISKVVAKGDKLKVSVNVAKESDSLVSKPISTLVSQLSTGNKNNKQSGNGKSSSQTGKNAVNQGSQQLKNSAAQGLDQQTKTQASKFQSEMASQGKGAAKGATQSGTASQSITSGGGDTPLNTGPGGVSEPGRSQQNVAAKAAAPKQVNIARQPVVDQVSVQITKAIAAGADKISIQLKPNSLGRIEVQLEVAKSGHVSAVVIADNKNTLDLLQNGSDELKQALQNAGLNTDSGSLNFGLREENQMADGRGGGGGSSVGNGGSAGCDDDNIEAAQVSAGDTNIITDNRVDVRA